MTEKQKTEPRITFAPAWPKRAGKLRRIGRALGPGFITGASDDDPSGIGTYALAGAVFGYTTLWLALVTTPLMAGIQYICAKIGLVTGCGVAGALRSHFPPWVLYGVVGALFVANTLNAGVDIGAIAAAINMLIPGLPITWLVAPIGLGLLALQVWGNYKIIRGTFKWLAMALLAYIGAAFFAHPDWHAVLRGTLTPTLSPTAPYLSTLVAILGTTISPYLFFWQASQEVEEEKSLGRLTVEQRRGASGAELQTRAWDVTIGMTFSNVVMYFIILATAATLHVAGKTDIQTAAQAAQALRPLAGEQAALLFALGMIGSGCLAVPILTASSAFSICEALDWHCGLDARLHEAKGFYAIIAASTVLGLLINFVGFNPIQALYWTAVLNGLLAPPLMTVIMLIASNRKLMGDQVISPLLNVLGWLATVVMYGAGIGLVWSVF